MAVIGVMLLAHCWEEGGEDSTLARVWETNVKLCTFNVILQRGPRQHSEGLWQEFDSEVKLTVGTQQKQMQPLCERRLVVQIRALFFIYGGINYATLFEFVMPLFHCTVSCTLLYLVLMMLKTCSPFRRFVSFTNMYAQASVYVFY